MMHRNMRLLLVLLTGVFTGPHTAVSQVSLNELLSYPYPDNLCAAPASGSLAWTFNKEGERNIFISEDHGWSFKKLTHYADDDGQAISKLQFSPDGMWLVYMRGGGPHANWSTNKPVNPRSDPVKPKFALYSLNTHTGKTKVLATAPSTSWPAISPDSRTVVYLDDGELRIVQIDGRESGKRMFFARGDCSDPKWSPDGTKLAFVSNRGRHSFIGIYTDGETPIQWIDPAFARDGSPVWSPAGDSIVFVRRPAYGGAPDSLLNRNNQPWEIRVADAQSGSSRRLWKSPATFNGSVPTTDGKYNLHWAAGGRIVFLSTQDNWPHLYSIPSNGGAPLELTPGHFMVEYVGLSPDRKQIVFSANTGPDKYDIDRRHIGVVSVDNPDMKILTPGAGIEANAVFLDQQHLSFISSTPFRPALPAVYSMSGKETKVIGKSLLSSVYASKALVRPKQVIFESLDGIPVHGQLFEKPGGKVKKPAILCIHGGPMRQMLLGWSYSDYYAAHYAVNQWLANQGFVVLSINYRLGIGYGNAFHHPPGAGKKGASEYQDVLAAGQWLAHQPFVDADRIGVYGGSYGGYLTAFALGRNSDVFAAGVDISGVHSRVPGEKYTVKIEHAPDAAEADSVVWFSSPIAYVDTWKSPVLLIHADDDRNVDFDHSINLFNRLRKKGVDCETLVIPDDTHHWLRFSNLCKVYNATVDFFVRKLKEDQGAPPTVADFR